MWQEASLVSWHLLFIGLGKGQMGCCLILAAGDLAPCSDQPFLPSPEGPKGTTGWGVVPARSPHQPLPKRAAFRCAGPRLDPRLGKTSKTGQGRGGSGAHLIKAARGLRKVPGAESGCVCEHRGNRGEISSGDLSKCLPRLFFCLLQRDGRADRGRANFH